MARVIAALPGSVGYAPAADVGSAQVKVLARIRGGAVVAP
jgi:hypothetical protein